MLLLLMTMIIIIIITTLIQHFVTHAEINILNPHFSVKSVKLICIQSSLFMHYSDIMPVVLKAQWMETQGLINGSISYLSSGGKNLKYSSQISLLPLVALLAIVH